MQMPSLPFPDQNPNSQRALKNNGGSNSSGGTKTGRGSGGYSN
jgi:hypothetical protein